MSAPPSGLEPFEVVAPLSLADTEARLRLLARDYHPLLGHSFVRDGKFGITLLLTRYEAKERSGGATNLADYDARIVGTLVAEGGQTRLTATQVNLTLHRFWIMTTVFAVLVLGLLIGGAGWLSMGFLFIPAFELLTWRNFVADVTRQEEVADLLQRYFAAQPPALPSPDTDELRVRPRDLVASVAALGAMNALTLLYWRHTGERIVFLVTLGLSVAVLAMGFVRWRSGRRRV